MNSFKIRMLKAARFVLRTIRKVYPFDVVDKLLGKIRFNLYDAGCVDTGMPYEPNAKEIEEKLAQQVKDLLAAQQEDERLYKEATEHNVANKCKEWDKLATSLEKEGKFKVSKAVLSKAYLERFDNAVPIQDRSDLEAAIDIMYKAYEDMFSNDFYNVYANEIINRDMVYEGLLDRRVEDYNKKMREFPRFGKCAVTDEDIDKAKNVLWDHDKLFFSLDKQCEKEQQLKQQKEEQPKRKKGRPKHKLNSLCVTYMEDPGKRMEKLIKDEKRMKKDV